ncbi:MAG: hypothetical protein HN380_18870 [Victivallales bacterium]|nr:hypothetical protein [Victivallales bacterium]
MRAAPRHCGCGSTLLIAILLTMAWTQLGVAAPQLGYVYPAGGAQGTTFRVEAGGQSLRNVDGVRVSGAGVRAEVVEYVRSMDNDDMRDTERFLRDLVMRRWVARVMDEAAKKKDGPALPDHPWLRGLDEMSPNEVSQLRTRLFDPRKQPNAQLAEKVILEITIAPGAPPGDRELRLLGPSGLSAPICFQVGLLPELRENEFAGGPAGRVVEPPAMLNGQIMPGEVDRIRLRARQGQKLAIRLQARRLIPYLADAVPGWFQAVMSLHAPSGEEVAWSDDYRFDPDPALFYDVPADGVYDLVVRDAIYRGRDDFVYRIAVGEFPLVTQAFPLGAQVGTAATSTAQGWNMPATAVSLDTRPSATPIRQATVGLEQGFCSEVRYVVDAWPEVAETESDQAQQVAFPQTVNGRIDRPGDVDAFRFAGRAGQAVVAEVLARRLNSPLDSVLRLVDSEGVEVAVNDDYKDREMGLVTHQADSQILLKLPKDGAYTLSLSDAQRQGSEAHAYRLRIRPGQPDFALRLVPSAINVSGGGAASCTVHVLRKEGFKGEVNVALVDAPEGFKLSNTKIPADKEKVVMRLSVPRGVPRQVLAIRLAGQANVGETEIRRAVVPAEDMMQAFLWRFLVPREELLVAVTGSRPVPTVWRPILSGTTLALATPVQIPLGGTAQVRIDAPQMLPDGGGTPLSSVRFQIANRPRGVTLRDATVVPSGITLTLQADRNIAWKGDVANAIIEASIEPKAGADGDMKGIPSRVSLGVLPAIPFEVVQQ